MTRARVLGVEFVPAPLAIAWDVEGPKGFPLGIRAASPEAARAEFLEDRSGRWSDFALAGWRVVPAPGEPG